MIEFISHGSFLIRIKEIKFAYVEDATVIVTVNEDGKDRRFIMNYRDHSDAKDAFNKLSQNLDPVELGLILKNSLIRRIEWCSSNIRELIDEINKLKKETNLLRKQLRIKNDKVV